MGKNEYTVDKKVPVVFQVTDTFEQKDERFVAVKIWLMHTGLNHNGSVFSRQSIERAIPTLKNTPVLAYIERNEDNEKDFSDHRSEVVIEDGEFKEKYMGQAIGIIPETNNAQFEYRVCDDGVEREFLTVQGLLWTKWEDPVKILQESSFKNQSMELSSNYSGRFDAEGYFHFTDFKFFGACVLGDHVAPAMEGSTVEISFAQDEVDKIVQEKLEQFSLHFTKEGVVTVENKSVTEEKEFEATEATEAEAVVEDSVEDTKEVEAETVENTEDVTNTPEVPEAEMAVEDNVEDTTEVTVANELVEYQTKYGELQTNYDELKTAFDTLQKENQELKLFKREAELDSLRKQFEGKLDTEKLNEVFESMLDASVEEIEKEVFATIGRLSFEKLNSIPTKRDVDTKLSFSTRKEEDKSPYGNFFKK